MRHMCYPRLSVSRVATRGARGHAAAVCVRVLRLTSSASPSAPLRAPVPSAAVERRVCHDPPHHPLMRLYPCRRQPGARGDLDTCFTGPKIRVFVGESDRNGTGGAQCGRDRSARATASIRCPAATWVHGHVTGKCQGVPELACSPSQKPCTVSKPRSNEPRHGSRSAHGSSPYTQPTIEPTSPNYR